ncbi:MAG: hypothetical protein H0W53_18075 [Acidobacteria bacterium]|nr:hypothetical protein [Acidobacteriota bacterium]
MAGVNEYGLATKSLALRPDDQELQFGAAFVLRRYTHPLQRRISPSQLITGIQLVKHLGRQSDLDFRGTPERLDVTRPADQWVPTGGALLKTTALASWSLS